MEGQALGVEIELPPDKRAPSIARKALRELEAVLGPELDTVALLATELVTNAIRHSSATPETPIHLCTELKRDCIRVEVKDPGPRFVPRPYEDAPLQESGRGLLLVEEISQRWGIDHHDGNQVWFEVEVPANGNSPR